MPHCRKDTLLQIRVPLLSGLQGPLWGFIRVTEVATVRNRVVDRNGRQDEVKSVVPRLRPDGVLPGLGMWQLMRYALRKIIESRL
jgi:hypothetical protein